MFPFVLARVGCEHRSEFKKQVLINQAVTEKIHSELAGKAIGILIGSTQSSQDIVQAIYDQLTTQMASTMLESGIVVKIKPGTTFDSITVSCRDCRVTFVFTSAEQDFFQEKGWPIPRQRCEVCTVRRKISKKHKPGKQERAAKRALDLGGQEQIRRLHVSHRLA